MGRKGSSKKITFVDDEVEAQILSIIRNAIRNVILVLPTSPFGAIFRTQSTKPLVGELSFRSSSERRRSRRLRTWDGLSITKSNCTRFLTFTPRSTLMRVQS